MVAFMSYSGVTLLCGKALGNASNIDIIVRTTMAAIFGYFISSNFMSKEIVSKKSRKQSQGLKKLECTCKIEEVIQEPKETNLDNKQENRIQIMIVTAIGLISLFILFLSRECTNTPQDALATISQFRSFVSGCVGFLIGIPPEKKQQ